MNRIQKLRRFLLNEAPVYGDEGDIQTNPLPELPQSGQGYGIKGSSEIAKKMADLVVSKIFKREQHEVKSKMYTLYYPGNPTSFKARIIDLLVQNFPITRTEAGYTSRILMNNVMKVLAVEEGGGLAANKPAVIKAVISTPMPTEGGSDKAAASISDPTAEEGIQTWTKGKGVHFHFPEDQDVYDRLDLQFKIPTGSDLYDSEEFKSAVKSAVEQVSSDYDIENKLEYVTDFIQTAREKTEPAAFTKGSVEDVAGTSDALGELSTDAEDDIERTILGGKKGYRGPTRELPEDLGDFGQD